MIRITTRWAPASELDEQWSRLIAVSPSAQGLVESVCARIQLYDPLLWDEMQHTGNRRRRDNYLLRYGLPIADLYGWPAKCDEILIDALAVHFFWSVCWRRMDDVLDAHGAPPADVAAMAASLCRASRVHTLICERSGHPWSDEVVQLLQSLCLTAAEERQQSIPRIQIWRRATPFLIAARTLLNLPESLEAIYRAYINLDGLAHDIHDVLGDFKLGIRSLPTSWFTELDPDAAFRRDVVDAWFDKARSELRAAILAVRQTGPVEQYPVIDFFVRQFEDMAESLGRFSRPKTTGTAAP